MAEHPCANGLTAACFKEYPEWARKALAYKLLVMMIPPELSEKLPGRILAVGKSCPPGWPAGADPPKFLKAIAAVPAAARSRGVAASVFHSTFSAGPVHPPAPAPSKIEYTTTFPCLGTERTLNVGTPWATKHDTTTGASVTLITGAYIALTASDPGGFYAIGRLTYKFDLSGLPAGAEMISGYVSLKVYSKTAGTAISIQRAPATSWNAVGDFLLFEGAADDYLVIVGTEQILDLGSLSLAYCKGQAGGVGYFMAREYAHDYLNIAPGAGETWESAIYTQAATPETRRPTLVLSYKA